jgi:6-phosphogluconolactonase
MFPAQYRLHSFTSVEVLTDIAAAAIEAAANASIAARGKFHIVLAGGRTPQAVYAKLSRLNTDWRAWHIYFGDERCLPSGDANRNDTMAFQQWLSESPIPRAQIFPMPSERGAEEGAAAYCQIVQSIDLFDLVLLGLGEDGHTASLFPGHHWSGAPAIAVHNSPKPPADRISLSAERLSQAREVWFLVTGVDKANAMRQWQQGEPLPAAAIQTPNGVDIYTDLNLTELART